MVKIKAISALAFFVSLLIAGAAAEIEDYSDDVYGDTIASNHNNLTGNDSPDKKNHSENSAATASFGVYLQIVG